MWATKNFDPPGIVPKCLQIHWFIPSNPRCRCIKHPCSMIPIMWFHSVSSPRTNNEKHGFRGCCFRALHGFQGNLVKFAKSHGRHSRWKPRWSKHAMRRLLRGSARDGRPSEICRVALEPFQGSCARSGAAWVKAKNMQFFKGDEHPVMMWKHGYPSFDML